MVVRGVSLWAAVAQAYPRAEWSYLLCSGGTSWWAGA